MPAHPAQSGPCFHSGSTLTVLRSLSALQLFWPSLPYICQLLPTTGPLHMPSLLPKTLLSLHCSSFRSQLRSQISPPPRSLPWSPWPGAIKALFFTALIWLWLYLFICFVDEHLVPFEELHKTQGPSLFCSFIMFPEPLSVSYYEWTS